jgi:HK97 gp10 family phage protein
MTFKLQWHDKELKAKVKSICKKIVLGKARDVAIDAKMNVPVDSGELLNTIEVVAFEKPEAVGAYVKAGGKKLGHIARFVELGTPGTVYKTRSKKGKVRTPIKAQPYLRPALRKHKQKIKNAYRNKLK